MGRDIFLNNPSIVRPKLQVRDHLASRGVLCPPVYPNLTAALASQKSFLMRADGKGDHDGVSGIFQSYAIKWKNGKFNFDNISDWHPGLHKTIGERLAGSIADSEFERRLAASEMGFSGKNYIAYSGGSESDLAQEIGWSYWKLLGGYNLSLAADKAIQGRYHIVMKEPARGNANLYAVVEGNRVSVVGNYSNQMHPDLVVRNHPDFVRFYESIRQSDCFDGNHCPIVECQWEDGLLYFLQYHRTRDFSPRQAPTGQTVTMPANVEDAFFVTGTTPPEGKIYRTKVVANSGTIPPRETWNSSGIDGFLSLKLGPAAQLNFASMRYDSVFYDDPKRGSIGAHHARLSALLKTKLSVSANFSGQIPSELREKMSAHEEDTGKACVIPIWVCSDGRDAQVKMLVDQIEFPM